GARADGLLYERLPEDRLPRSGRAEDHDVSEERVVREDYGFFRLGIDSDVERHDSASGGQDRVTRERHILLSGVPSGCLRWRGRWQRRLEWRRRRLGWPTSPANGHGDQD